MTRLRAAFTLRALLIAGLALLIVVPAALFAPLALRGPRVVSVSPADGSGDANPLVPIRIEFDQQVRAESVAAALKLDPPTDVSVEREGNAVLVQPKGGLRYGAAYRLTIGTGVRNALGRAMAEPLALAFTTLPYVGVASFTPAGAAKDVPLNAPLTVEFAAPVVSAAQVAAAANDPRLAAQLPGASVVAGTAPLLVFTPAISGTGRWLSPTQFSFAPAGGWDAATAYSVTLSPALTSDGRARLEQPLAWSFATAAALLDGTRPFDGAQDVAADAPIELRLARGVNADSAAKSFSLIAAEDKTPVEGSVAARGAQLLFKPAAPLARGTRYEARIASGVLAASGQAINAQPLSWSFTVIGDLAVQEAIPAPDASDVPSVTTQISVRFNHPVVAVTTIDPKSTAAPPVEVTPAVKGVGRWLDTSTYAISLTAPLDPATTYRVRVPAGLSDQSGGALRDAYSWSFTTVAPSVSASVPSNDEQYASPRDPLAVVFNQPMDAASLRRTLSLADESGAPVVGTIAISGNTATFTPAAPLARGARYTLSVDASAQAAGSSATLANAYRASFRVAPPPAFSGSDPADAGVGNPNDPLQLQFSTPMDWASVAQNLTIDPKPTQIYTYPNEASLNLSFDMLPETTYSVLLKGAARDPYGVSLGQDVRFTYRTPALPPALRIVGPYQVGAYNASAAARVPVQTVNQPSISYDIYTIDAQEALSLLTDSERWQKYTPDLNSVLRGDVVRPEGQPNQPKMSMLEVGKLDPGFYYFEVRGAGIVERQLMAVSPYALTIKHSQGKLFLWAVDMATGKPVPNLPLSARSYSYDAHELSGPRELGTTDAEGVLAADFASGPYDPLYVVAGAGAPFAFASSGWSDGIDPYSFNLPANIERSPIAGSLSSDRPLYRPGQTVHIRGVVRRDDDGRYSLPEAGKRALLAVSDPQGTAIFSTTLALSPFGGFSLDLPIQPGARLGNYSLNARLEDGRDDQQFYGSFGVAEYRKPVFEVAVSPDKPDILRGDSVEATLSARYFAGGALAKAAVRWRLLAEPLYFSPESAPGYQFQDLDDADTFYRWFDSQRGGSGEQIAEGTAVTDAKGELRLSLPVPEGDAKGSRKLTLDVEVTDIDGQVIASQASVNLHAGAFYIGLRPEGYVAQAGQPQKVSLISLDPQGQPVGGRSVAVGVYSREWFSVREQGADGQFYFTSSYTDTLLQTIPATSDAQGRAEVSFTPPKGGSYRIAASAKDDGGREVASSAFTWAAGGDVFWGVDDTNRVDLIADRQSYKPGETAKVLVTAPYKGMTALMTIERGSVIQHKVMTLKGTSEVLEVPIDASYAPNVYLSLVLIKPGGRDLPVPDLRVGLANLKVSTEQQELTISLTPDKQQAGPRDSVAYTVKTTDHTGKGVSAEVSLALVDKAVLTLADDPNPTLRQAFYEKRPLGVFTAQSLVALVDRVTLKLQQGGKGGGGGGGLEAEPLARRNFPDTAYWNPALVTGADGTASFRVNLPDTLTTWRLTARGVSADTRVGQAAQEIIATKPLYVRPALPRFLTAGDTLTLQAVVQNTTAKPVEATVTLAADAQGGEAAPLTLGDPAEQTATVPANGQTLLRWRASAPAAGQALIRLSVKGAGLEDSVEQPLTVQRLATPEVVASAGQVLDTTTETLRLPEGTTTTQGEVALELTPSLAAGVQSGLDYLGAYPYACTEQTVSAFLPNAVSYRLFKQLGVENPALKAGLEQHLAAGLQRLTALQHLDGGWGWWADGESQPYISAYAVQGLSEAVKAGYSVDTNVLSNAIAYLQQALDAAPADDGAGVDERSALNARAYILFVLGEAGQPDRGRAVALYDQREKLDLYGRAFLLMTLKSLGDESRVKLLASDLASRAIMRPADAHWEEQRADYANMGSDTRTTALVLQALVRAQPDSFLVPNAARYLMSLREGGHWRTTQETATALMALAEYAAHSGELEGDYSYRVSLDGKALREGAVGEASLTDTVSLAIALADIKPGQGSQLTMQRQGASGQSGKGRLYYTLRMRSFEDAAKAEALDQGVGVRREYLAVDTATLSPTGDLISQAKLGDLVQVRLTLTVPEDMPYFFVEDMLPAGLEALDTSLKTTSAAVQDAALSAQGAEHPGWWYFGQTSIHDNRVALFATQLPKGTYSYTYLARATVPGAFQALPATASRMYAPEVFGRSAGALFTVSAP